MDTLLLAFYHLYRVRLNAMNRNKEKDTHWPLYLNMCFLVMDDRGNKCSVCTLLNANCQQRTARMQFLTIHIGLTRLSECSSVLPHWCRIIFSPLFDCLYLSCDCRYASDNWFICPRFHFLHLYSFSVLFCCCELVTTGVNLFLLAANLFLRSSLLRPHFLLN